MRAIKEVKRNIGSLFITWQLGHKAKDRPANILDNTTHTCTHLSPFQTMKHLPTIFFVLHLNLR